MRDAEAGAELLFPRAFEGGEGRSGRVAAFDRVRRGLAGHPSRFDGPANPFAEKTGSVAGRIADSQDAVAGELFRESLGGNQPAVMLDRLRIFESRDRGDESVEIGFG